MRLGFVTSNHSRSNGRGVRAQISGILMILKSLLRGKSADIAPPVLPVGSMSFPEILEYDRQLGKMITSP